MTSYVAQTPGCSPLRSVAVIGAGERGRAFALRCLEAGFEVVLEDVLSPRLRKAAEEIAEKSALRERLRLATSVEDAVREADVAIDFVPDELESKLEILSMMDRMAPPKTIFCSPTALSIADLASCTYRPSLCVGMTPCGDEIGQTVQLIYGTATAASTVDRVRGWLFELGLCVEVLADPAEPMLLPR